MEILYPTLDEVLTSHCYVIEESGGLPANGYSTELQGRINSILDHMQNDTYYPTFVDKLHHLLYSIIKNHIFLDGNKRSSLMVSSYFLYLNGYSSSEFLTSYMNDMEDIIVDVANNSIDKDKLHTILSEFISNKY